MKMDLTWKKLLGEGLSNQQIETVLLLGVVPIILLTIWFMVFLYNNLAVKPIMREHFPDDFRGIIASDETWKRLMKDLPPHFLVEKEKKVVFLIKGVFQEHLILNKYLPNFPEGYKGMVMRCEESFYKMRMKANSK